MAGPQKPLRTKSSKIPAGRWDVPLGRKVKRWQQITPPQLFVGSFLLLIGVGTLGLKLLPGLYQNEPLGWLDALYTSTSAVCITGLVVVDTAAHFTTRGQAFLLLLIQLGGLGMLTFTSLIITSIGRRLSLRAETLTAGSREVVPQLNARRLIVDMVLFTFTLEAVGAICFYIMWLPRYGWTEAIWPAVFHSVNSFCNAGFTVFPDSDSLIGFQHSPGTLAVTMALIIAGGFGFLTLEEVYLRWFRRKHKRKLSVHSQLVLWTSLVLLLGGWLLFALFEWNQSLADMPLANKLHNALFMSVTPRSSGFSTIDYAGATDSSNFLSILLMTIGGAPGSTAGGMKVTTFILLGLLAWSRLRSFETTIFNNRSIPDETVQRAVGLAVVAGGVIAVGVFALATASEFRTEEGRFLVRMFEAVSAFNTVGLSMGLTPYLSGTGRCVSIVLMVLGRVGPITLATALTVHRPRNRHFRYAYEDVVVG